jgi:bacterial leucyl aminopeptidase
MKLTPFLLLEFGLATPIFKLAEDPIVPLDLRLIETSETTREWMTESQVINNLTLIFELYKRNVKFVDITDGDWETIGLYQKLNSFDISNKPTFPSKPLHEATVKEYLELVDQTKMKKFLTSFSGFQTRYYKSQSGKDSAEWLHDQIKQLEKSAIDGTLLTVEKVEHSWNQFSIIARYANLESSEEDVLILSAHQDSVNQWNPWFGRSPGADDDGSGTTTIFEALRILVENGFIPKRPIEFHFYSAEEGGLLGSQKVVSKYLKAGKKVYAVLHNDMTGYQKSGLKPVIGISTDNVSKPLTETLRMLSEAYSGIQWKDTKCGYGKVFFI